MKKVIYRVLAFVLDLALVSTILLGLSYIDVINPESPQINLRYEDYYNSNSNYEELVKNLDNYFKDGKITQKEYDEIVSKYPDYFKVFNDVELNEDIKTSEMADIKNNLARRLQEINNDYGYKIEKLNIRSSIISIIVYILYFGVLQYFLKGQTVFKKIFRIRVVDNNDIKAKIPMWKYIVRSLLVCEVLITGINITCLLLLNKSNYITFNSWMVNAKYIYEMAFLVTMIIRDDARSIHDLLLKTEVVRFTKDGKVIEEKLFNDSDEDEENSHKNNKIVSKNANRNA